VSRLPGAGLAAYAVLALPLAMATLPVYVQVPRLYGAELGLGLAAVGAVLLAVRLFDAVLDPVIGWISDRRAQAMGDRKPLIVLAIPLVAAGTLWIFHPPPDVGVVWLLTGLALVHVGLSVAAIGHYAHGASLSRDPVERTRVTATRSAFALVGVLLAALVPEILAATSGRVAGVAAYSFVVAGLLAVGALVFLRGAPIGDVAASGASGILPALRLPFANARFRPLIAAFVLSATAAAVPATLVLFFVDDVLGRTDLAGAFLAVYFFAGACAMPLWAAIAARIGKRRAWLLGMVAAILAFVWAFLLGRGDVTAFLAVCVLSGAAGGADLALPASLLADVIDRDEAAGLRRAEGAYFGIWHFAEKLSLAAAAGLALPALAAAGYVPGSGPSTALSAAYALLPCGLKLAAFFVLLVWMRETPLPVALRPA
jgi:Na+/melibiose symporter-like transporter